MRDQVFATHALAARTTSERLASQLDAWYSIARSLSEDPAIASGDSGALAALVRDGLQTWSGYGVQAIAIVDPEGALVLGSRTTDIDLERIPTLDWLPIEEHRRQAFVSDDREQGPEIRPLAFAPTPFVRAAIGAAGFVVIAGDRSLVEQPLLAMEILESTEAELFAIDSRGRVVAGFGDPERLSPQVLEAVVSGRVGGTSVFEGRAEGDPDGADSSSVGSFLAAYNPVGRWPVRVISMQPQAVAERVAHSMRQRAALIVLLAIGLIALLLTLSYATVVQPLRRLLGAQRRLAHLPGTAETASDDAGGDLIQQLETTFSALEERVRDSEHLGKVFLGRYQVVELVGRGGMGTVFRGWDPKLERPVALKTVRLGTGELGDSPEEVHEKVRSLLQEAVLVAQLNHPNVVTVYDFEEFSGSAFLAMELVDGITLEHLHYFGDVETGMIAPLGLNLARALEAAHSRGVLHRDIKAPNVLLGYDHSVKVVDFGLAQLTNATRSSDDGMVFGTPGYVAPEVIKGDGPSEGADLFALGVVLYESAAGRLPFSGVNIPAILRSTVRGEYEPLEQQRRDLEADLLKLIDELLRTEPGERPSAAETVDRLDVVCNRTGQTWRLPYLEGMHREQDRHSTRARAQWIETTTFGMRAQTG